MPLWYVGPPLLGANAIEKIAFGARLGTKTTCGLPARVMKNCGELACPD